MIKKTKIIIRTEEILFYLHHVGPDFLFFVSALQLDDLEDPGGEGVVVDPPAGPEGGGNDGGLGDHVKLVKVGHSLADLPAVNVLTVEVGLVAGVEVRVALHGAGGHPASAGHCKNEERNPDSSMLF